MVWKTGDSGAKRLVLLISWTLLFVIFFQNCSDSLIMNSLSGSGNSLCIGSDCSPPPPPPPSPPPPPDNDSNDTSPKAKLLFKSGFEEGVIVEPAYVSGGDWWQRLTGSDISGFSWPLLGGQFQYLVDGTKVLSDYARTRIEEVIGPYGKPTRALMHGMWNNSGKPCGCSQSDYLSYLDSAWEGDIYIRYWLKFNPNWRQTARPLDYSIVWEWKAGGDSSPGFRRNLILVAVDGSGRFAWVGKIDGPWTASGLSQDKEVYWEKWNYDVEVPIGEWFTFEVHSRPRNDLSGLLWMAVNGKVVFDYRGPTLDTGKLTRIMWFLAYGTAKLDRPIYQWVDDFEVWDGRP